MTDPDLESTDPDIHRAAEKRAAAAAAERGDVPAATEPEAPKASKARRQTTRG